jgi:uncharacterized protein (UPF0332 family)
MSGGPTMSEIDLLLTKAQESIDAAQTLLEQSYPDFAASRAYYALFYVAQALLLAKDQTFSSHAAVIAAFGKEYTKTKALDPKFHRYLILAQSERNVGDYGIGEKVAPEDAAKLMGWAREFLAVARQHLSH